MPEGREKIQAKLGQIAALLKEEEVSAAGNQLHELGATILEGDLAIELALLKARVHLAERRFGAVQASLSELKKRDSLSTRHREIAVLEAYCRALAGEARKGFALVAPLVREASPFDEIHAQASYIAGLCLFRVGHYKPSAAHIERAAAYYRLANDKIELSRMLNSLALLEKSRGRLEVALRHLDEASRILPQGRYLRHRRRLLTNRGVCFLRMGQPALARGCLLEARRLSQSERDLFVDVAIHNNLGHAYRICGEYDSARECYFAALGDARNASSLRQECLSLEFIGELFLETGQLDECKDYLERAHVKALQLAPQGDLMMEVLRRRGELHAALGRKAEAEADLERAIQLCGARGEERERVLAQRALVLLRGDESTLGDGIQAVLSSLKALGDQFEFVRTIYLVLRSGHGELVHLNWFQEAVVIATYYADALDVELWRKRLRDVVGHARSVVRRGSGPRNLQGELMVSTRSRSFTKCLEDVSLAARSDCAVLIAGETGTGKEVIARLVHDQSGRATGPLVAINCGALPESLVESELFGHVRGTFTGAHRDKEGLFEAAAGGTVLLDEIGDLPAHTQVKLLRFLDSCEYRRVGETRIRKANVRVLAATNRDLRSLVEAGKFREDLLFRLNVFQIDVPPLRTRKDDILPLAEFFMKQACRPGMQLEFSDEVKLCLEAYGWSGNIREMRNLCQYLAAKAWGRSKVVLEDLPDSMRRFPSDCSEVLPKFERERRDLERAHIGEALRQSDGKILRAAKLLGMGRNRLAVRMKELGIERESFRI